ncbi:MAG: aspartate aminotransferase family protein [Bacteroidales bacterium]|nr:aspartate aminotransferase family protein [Bacteroidales bacterium]
MEKWTENNAHRALFFQHLGQTSPEPMGLEIERAEGVRLFGPQGKSYMDLISGVGVSNIGHGHPKVVDAIWEQAGAYSHLMVYGEFIQAPQVKYAELLTSQLPEPLKSVYFVNSGSEAVEAALKLAKRLTGRRELIGCKHAYHGSTHGALSLIGDESFKQPFRPLLPAVQQIRFNHIEDLALISAATAAVLVEPVQAEAGVVLPQAGYLEALQERCRQTGALLIFDEIQTGFGRTGALFAFQKYGVVPDMLCLAKALGGGMPLGALVTGPDLMKAWQSEPALGHITTFGGHPICCAAGMAALEVILAQNLSEEAEEKGQWFREHLAGHSRILDMRGAGLLWACRLSSEEEAKNFVRVAAEEGIILDRFLFCGSAFRISPPLTIDFQEIDDACTLIVKALERI